ncbi:hypothetical protein LIER_39989 [Lithospermum erythrorhizon]|uniref:Uncharacterized protein n=1 Tax=Lithospermum erythrorhizon TaxID=34254 RepID=A0AAV3QN51_LITER
MDANLRCLGFFCRTLYYHKGVATFRKCEEELGNPRRGEHDLGNVSLKNRMRFLEEKIGVQPSPFIILLEQNRKKNKVSGDCEVHNKKFEVA